MISTWNNWFFLRLVFLDHTKSIQSVIEQNLVILTCTILTGTVSEKLFVCWQQCLIPSDVEIWDIIILDTNKWKSLIVLEPIHNLLLHENAHSFLNFRDAWHGDLRIRCFRANFSLEGCFPALKVHWVWKCCKMQFRERPSRIFHHINVRISSTTMTYLLRIGLVLLLRSHLRPKCHCLFWDYGFHSTRRRCQIIWIFEIILRISFMSR